MTRKLIIALSTLALFFCASANAQTVQNPSFEVLANPLSGNAPGPWSYGPIPNWVQSFSNGSGLWQPPATYLAAADGTTIAWVSNSSISQDLGTQQAGVYQLSVSVGHRPGLTGTWTISIGPCSVSGNTATILSGAFAQETLPCTTQVSSDLVITLDCAGHCVFDMVAVNRTPQTFVFTLPNCGPNGATGGTCTFTFPMAGPPTCTATAPCTIQVCDNATPSNCLTLQSGGVISIMQPNQETVVVSASSP